MQEYVCYTNMGKWKFYAEDDISVFLCVCPKDNTYSNSNSCFL